jgi:DNA-binding CsgD family transcriptional regulator
VNGPGVVQPIIDSPDSIPVPVYAPLTQDEEEVLRVVAASRTHQQMAEQLAMSVSEVFALPASAMQKAGLTTRMQIINFARAHRWIEQMETPSDS